MASRPLHHPPMKAITLAGILYALSDPVRLSIVSELFQATQRMNCSEIKNKISAKMPKSTCSQHFQILRETGLIQSKRKGVELESQLRIKEIEKKFPGLLINILKAQAKETKKIKN